MAATEVILLERIEKLGQMGDVVNVKPGYARNYLIPQNKALRATKSNVAYFEAQKKHLEAENEKKRKAAEKNAKTLDGVTATLIRQASESGQLYGSVTSRDIARQISDASGISVDRNMVDMNQTYKTVGLFAVELWLHPEVKVEVTVNIARSPEEAKIQAETGRALVAEEDSAQPLEEIVEEAAQEAELESVLEDSALEAEKQKQADAEEQAAEEARKAGEKAAADAEEAGKAEADSSSETEGADKE